MLSLSWGAARAFMIMRTADKADPDPELMTISLRIWPRMVLITIADLLFLAYIAGLSGGYVFIAIFINFLTTYGVLWKTLKITSREDSGDRKEQEQIPMLAEAGVEKAKEEEEDFIFTASICSTWIPSVVGDPKQRFFLKAGEVLDLSTLSKSTLS